MATPVEVVTFPMVIVLAMVVPTLIAPVPESKVKDEVEACDPKVTVLAPVPPVAKLIVWTPVPVPMAMVPVCAPVPPMVMVPEVMAAPMLTDPPTWTLAMLTAEAPDPLAIKTLLVPEDEPKVRSPVWAVPPMVMVPVVVAAPMV